LAFDTFQLLACASQQASNVIFFLIKEQTSKLPLRHYTLSIVGQHVILLGILGSILSSKTRSPRKRNHSLL